MSENTNRSDELIGAIDSYSGSDSKSRAKTGVRKIILELESKAAERDGLRELLMSNAVKHAEREAELLAAKTAQERQNSEMIRRMFELENELAALQSERREARKSANEEPLDLGVNLSKEDSRK